MVLDLLTRPEVRVDEVAGGDDDNCLICWCRPRVTLCGGYASGPVNDEGWVEEETCPECVRVAEAGCPACGCTWRSTCRMCARVPAGRESRPWWRRWLR